MAEYSEDQIRKYAHQLWEKEGKPEGKAEHFWLQAKKEMDEDAPAGDLDTPKPMHE